MEDVQWSKLAIKYLKDMGFLRRRDDEGVKNSGNAEETLEEAKSKLKLRRADAIGHPAEDIVGKRKKQNQCGSALSRFNVKQEKKLLEDICATLA